MAKGNVGDRILVVDEDSGLGAYMNGHKGTICLVEEGYGGAYVHFDHIEKQGDGEYLYAEEYEIIAQASQEPLEQSIPWAVGQEVFCLLRGKGVVTEFDSDDKVYPVRVDFETGDTDWYTSEGKEESNYNRSLFFSDPQIIADKLPPKKPFIPVLNKGDTIVLQTKIENFVSESYVYTVEHETEDEICCLGGDSYTKAYWTVHKLGDKVEFNV